jgi:hypothetical protein
MSFGLFLEALNRSDACEGGRFSLKLDRERAHTIRLGALDGEASPTAPFPRDAQGRVRLPDGSANAVKQIQVVYARGNRRLMNRTT